MSRVIYNKDMKQKEIICILGGSGFVGTELCAHLIKEGYGIKVVSRNVLNCRHLLIFPALSVHQIQNYSTDQIAKHLNGCTTLINLIGILNERKNNGKQFHEVHVGITRSALQACEQTNVTRMLQMSALNADPNGPSYYLQSKGKAENYLMAFSKDRVNVTIFKPSVIFGPKDSFLNRFANLLKVFPIAFPLACADARFAPVYVGDIVKSMTESIHDKATFNESYNLCGPDIYTLKQLVEYTAKLCGISCRVICLPMFLSKLQASIFEYLPGKPFSKDNYKSLKIDSVCPEGNTCDTSLEAIAPMYLAKKSALNLDRFRSVRR
ncbi:MAG: complex I NDUFA9 subunit family protein [Pseudomonadota bacterium]